MIQLYFGDGKGKTTAAVGQAVRAIGAGLSVAFVQFLKGSPSGETASLEMLGALLLRCENGTGFAFNMTDEQKARVAGRHNDNLRAALGSGCDMLVLDELCDAYSLGLIDKAQVERLLEAPPCELVITGHTPDDIFLEHADCCTEMKKIRHPFDSGVPAKKGIEY